MKTKPLFNRYTITDQGKIFDGDKEVHQYYCKTDECWQVCLTDKAGRKVKKHVARLIAIAFVERPRGTECVINKSGDKAVNSAANLKWITLSEKQKIAYNKTKKRFDPDETAKIANCMPWK